ncbi:MAG: NACHT domain-containing NTPase [Candidatus Nitrosocosmicus sp.]
MPKTVFSTSSYARINENNYEEEIKKYIFSLEGSFETQIKRYSQRVIDDFEGFQTYNKHYTPIVKNFKKYDTYNLFISQNYTIIPKEYTEQSNDKKISHKRALNKNIKKKILDTLINSQSDFIPIVGNYGSGKSLLAMHLLYDLCKENSDTSEIPPFYIPLGDLNYSKKFEDRCLLLIHKIHEYIIKTYKIIDKEKTLESFKFGKTILILDALDELSPTIDEEDISNNLLQIKYLTKTGNKVILTSRHTYLSNAIKTKFIKDHDLFKLEDFDLDLVQEFLDKNHNLYDDGDKKLKILEFIDKQEISDIVEKPLFVHIIYKEFERIKKTRFINPATIFQLLTDEWIIFDIDRNENLSEREKEELNDHRQRISEVLAIYANQKNDTAISKKDIENQVAMEFWSDRASVKDKLDKYYKDAQNSTFLIRDQDRENENTFSFIYRSVMEYFVARRIVTTINKKNDKDLLIKYSQQINTPETFAFVHYNMDSDWQIKPQFMNELQSRSVDNSVLKEIRSKTENLDFIYDTMIMQNKDHLKIT